LVLVAVVILLLVVLGKPLVCTGAGGLNVRAFELAKILVSAAGQ
jgi:hypothetical protein